MKKAYVDQKLCVACGCCITACKLGAINIPSGTHAEIDYKKMRWLWYVCPKVSGKYYYCKGG